MVNIGRWWAVVVPPVAALVLAGVWGRDVGAGLLILVGGVRHRVVEFRVEGVTAALATLTALATMALVLPTFTTSSPGPSFSPAQLAFAGTMSLILYAVFVFMQTVRHRNYFLPPGGKSSPTEDEHAPPPRTRTALISLGLLVVCLVAVVGLAKTAAPAIERAVAAVGAPHAVV